MFILFDCIISECVRKIKDFQLICWGYLASGFYGCPVRCRELKEGLSAVSNQQSEEWQSAVSNQQSEEWLSAVSNQQSVRIATGGRSYRRRKMSGIGIPAYRRIKCPIFTEFSRRFFTDVGGPWVAKTQYSVSPRKNECENKINLSYWCFHYNLTKYGRPAILTAICLIVKPTIKFTLCNVARCF